MGTGYSRNDTPNNIADGKIIDAADLDGEFDAIQAAFVLGTGHTHDGTSGEGGPVSVIGPAQDFIASGTDLSPKTDSIYDLGKTAVRWANGYFDALDSTALAGNLTGDVTGNVTGDVIGNLTGNVTGNADTATTLATPRNFSLAGDVTSPAVGFDGSGAVTLTATVVDDSHNHTLSTITDAGTIASQDANAVNIDGGAIDGTPIGSSAASTGAFTTLEASGALGSSIKASLINLLYPVGALYLEVSGVNPGTTFGVGTWVAHAAGRAIVGVGSNGEGSYTIGQERGSETHTLSTSEMPAHTHGAGTLATSSEGNHQHKVAHASSVSNNALDAGNETLVTIHTSASSSFNAELGGNSAVTANVGNTNTVGAHTHTISGATGSEGLGDAHNNVQPSIGVYVWRRTA